jgi:hypothetical protein
LFTDSISYCCLQQLGGPPHCWPQPRGRFSYYNPCNKASYCLLAFYCSLHNASWLASYCCLSHAALWDPAVAFHINGRHHVAAVYLRLLNDILCLAPFSSSLSKLSTATVGTDNWLSLVAFQAISWWNLCSGSESGFMSFPHIQIRSRVF